MTLYTQLVERIDSNVKQLLALPVDINQKSKYTNDVKDVLVGSLFGDFVDDDKLQIILDLSKLKLAPTTQTKPEQKPQTISCENPAPAPVSYTASGSFGLFIELITMLEAGRENEAKKTFDKIYDLEYNGDFDAQLAYEICRLNGIFVDKDECLAWENIERLAGVCNNVNAQFVCGMQRLSVYQKNRSPEALAEAQAIMDIAAPHIDNNINLFWRDHQNLIH